MEIQENVINYIKSIEFKICPVLDDREKFILKCKFVDQLHFTEISYLMSESKNRNFHITVCQVGNICRNSINKIRLYLIPKTPKMKIQDSSLSIRIKSALIDDTKFIYLFDFNGCPRSKLMKRNLGRISLQEIEDYIAEFGFTIDYEEREKTFAEKFPIESFSQFKNKELVNWIAKLTEILIKRNLK